MSVRSVADQALELSNDLIDQLQQAEKDKNRLLDCSEKLFEELIQMKGANRVLLEMTNLCSETLSEVFKVTGNYHNKILLGEATNLDVIECSKIVQRSLRSLQRYDEMRKHYNKCIREKSFKKSEVVNIVKLND